MSAPCAAAGDVERLERHLVRLGRRDPSLAAALRGADATEARVVQGSRGGRTVSCGGTLLASAYDPEAEGRRLAAAIADGPVDVLVAIGLGLGHHLETFRRARDCPVLVYEPSAARVRAALEARDGLPLLEQEGVALTCDPARLRELVAEHYLPGLRMCIFPHPTVLRLDPGAVRSAVADVARQKDSIDLRARTRARMMDGWAEATIRNAPALLSTPSVSTLFGAFPDVPAVVCAAGPSLDKQLALLAGARPRVLVIAIGQSLGALRAAGVEPDLVHVVESQDVRHQIERGGPLGALPLVVAPQSHPGLFRVPAERRLVAWQDTNPFGCWMADALGERDTLPSGGTVAQCAVFLAAAFGANPILLVGQDLAFTGGRVYARGSCYDEVGLESAGHGRFEYTNLRRKMGEDYVHDRLERDLIQVEGWDGEPVATDPAYACFRETYRDMGRALAARGTELWNCTEGGARIPGLVHRPFAEALALRATRPVDRSPLERLPRPPVAVRRGTFDAPLRRARRALGALERAAGAGRRSAREAAGRLDEAPPPEQIALLRRLSRAERAVQRSLSRLPFLDALVQPELQAHALAARREGAREPSPRDVAAESGALFDAALRATTRARQLLDAFEALAAGASVSDT